MRAILLAGGYGTRLRPLTNTTPKCLVPIHGKPLLDIWLQRLSAFGIGPFLINTHYLAEQVKEYVDSSRFRDVVTLAHEPTLLGTAGTLINNLEFFQEEDGLLIHADNYCMADYSDFQAAHFRRPSGCLITMMTFQTESPQSCGIVELNDANVVTAFHEKVAIPPGVTANGAVYALSAEFLRNIGKRFGDAKDFSTEVLPKLLGRIYTYETTRVFFDIGTIEAYQRANSLPDPTGNFCIQ